MRARVACAALAIGSLISLTAACSSGHASTTAASNGYGSGATIMIHAQLRPGTTGDEGSSLSQSLITKADVVFSNYTPVAGITVGLDKNTAATAIEQFLRAQPVVSSVFEGAPPTAPPATDTPKP
jgi:hypothetical protein